MLRITTLTDARSLTFKLEGRLAGAWVQELERCWRGALIRQGGCSLRVNLAGVTAIDADGKALLRKMHQHGTELVASGCLTKWIVEEVTRPE